jgi:hypothetical protein
MSYFGRKVVAYIDDRHVYGEWLLGFADRLTPDERKRIREGDLSAIVRELPPGWSEGDVLRVSPALEIRVGETRFNRRGRYRTVIVKTIDNRGGGRVTERRLREPLHEITTIVPVTDGPAYQNEYQRVPHSEVKKFPTTLQAKARYGDIHALDTQRRLRRSLIEDLRRADFSPMELAQLRAAMDAIRGSRDMAA